MNIMALGKLKKHFATFQQNHPRVIQFFQAVPSKLQVGSVIELSIKDPDGREISTNMKVNADDMELLRQLMEAGVGK